MASGWSITLYKQASQEAAPARIPVSYGNSVAVWSTGVYEIPWLDSLVHSGAAIMIESNGYPSVYTLQAADVAEHVPTVGPAISRWCTPEEWIVLMMWDLS